MVDNFSRNNMAREAGRKIAAVLQQLELDAGTTVENIHLTSTEVQNINEADPTALMLVRIELRRVAGTMWQT